MKTRIITGILFTLAVAGFILPGYMIPQLPLFFFFIVAAICIIEVSTALKNRKIHISQGVCVVGSLGVFTPLITALIHGDLNWRLITKYSVASPNELLSERTIIVQYLTESVSFLFLFLILYFYCVVFYYIITKGPMVLMDALSMCVTVFYIVVPLACALFLLSVIPNGYLWMIAAMVAAWVSDVFAYFAGVTLGKHKIVPLISPKKTWEGSIGGVIGSVFIMLIWFSVFMSGPDIVEKSLIYKISFGVILGLILSIVSQLGDWFASAIKRWAGTKDFGNVLPGHGGLTDRFDGVFFTFPVVLIGSLFYYLF